MTVQKGLRAVTGRRGYALSRSGALPATLMLALALTGCGGGSSSTPPTTPAVSVSLSQSAASVTLSQTTSFTATVSNTTNTAVTWTLSGAGTLDTSGNYTAPDDLPSNTAATVTATSQADTTKSASATVTITSNEAVSVSPSSHTLQTGAHQQFTATVTGSSKDTRITWSASSGTVTSSGLYTAPTTVPSGGAATVTAASMAAPSATGIARVTIQSGPVIPTNNVASVQVNVGPAENSANQLFASVTICVPGTSNCETIPDVLVDTGSSGLRLFASLVDLSLPESTDSSGNPIGNCAQFADNSYMWGPLVMADVQLTSGSSTTAAEKASSVPIQVVGAGGFPSVPAACNTGGVADDTVEVLGANGILGIGVFQQDCGSFCATNISSNAPFYFSCPSSGCVQTTVAVADQAQNPIALFPQDNNGVLISLPSVSADGAAAVSGSLIFGIGTQSNNGLGSARVYTTDDLGNFSTTFKGASYSMSFLDTGSNGLFFLDSTTTGLPNCSDDPGFYCPGSTMTFTAITVGTNGTSAPITFSIANADSLFSFNNGENAAFSNLGGSSSQVFDWGLPFFFGRNVFVAIQNESTPGGPGPYWAY
ncbi:MAG TPA: DUF3443 family protein [Terriglobia bacterium]